MRGAAHRILHDEALRLEEQFAGRARHSGIRHVKNCHLGGRQDISVLVSGDHRRFSGAESGSAENRPCPAGRRFCKQAWCPPSLAGVSAGQRGVHATCAVCPHTPHWLRAASYVRSGYCLRVSMCKVFLRCRDTHSAWRDDFRRLAEVRCRKVIRSDLARLFCTDLLHFRRCCLRARWSLHTRVHALDVFFRALGVFLCKVFLRCRDACSAWCDDFVSWLGCGAEQ